MLFVHVCVLHVTVVRRDCVIVMGLFSSHCISGAPFCVWCLLRACVCLACCCVCVVLCLIACCCCEDCVVFCICFVCVVCVVCLCCCVFLLLVVVFYVFVMTLLIFMYWVGALHHICVFVFVCCECKCFDGMFVLCLAFICVVSLCVDFELFSVCIV